MNEITEGNMLIAELMDDVTTDSKEWIGSSKKLVGEYLYHTSWDWLHGAYKKFFAITDFDTVTNGELYNRSPYFAQRLSDLRTAWASMDIKFAHAELAKAIKWYNNQSNPK